MRTKLVMVVLMLAIAWGLKRHYADARVEELSWIITPTAYLVSAVTGIGFEWRWGEGYFSHDRLFLIEKSCAGVNFLIAAFAMLVLAMLHRGAAVMPALGIIVAALIASYVSTVVVNALRIAIALWLTGDPLPISSLSASDAHRLEGIAVYFGGLVLLQELARRFDRRVFAAVRAS